MQKFIEIDQLLQEFISKLQLPIFDSIAKYLDEIGANIYVYLGLLLICLFFKKTRRFGMMACMSIVLTTCLVGYLKVTFDRPRPFVFRQLIPIIEVHASDYFVSFPSGHTAAIASIVSMWYFYMKKNLKCAIFLIILMAWSRIYLNMHYPLDTIGGCIIGTSVSFGLYSIFQMKRKRSKEAI